MVGALKMLGRGGGMRDPGSKVSVFLFVFVGVVD